MIAFEFVHTDEFAVEVFRRLHRLRESEPTMRGFRATFGSILVLLIVGVTFLLVRSGIGTWPQFVLAIGGPGFFLAVLLLTPRIDAWLFLRRFRHGPHRSLTTHMELGPDGVRVVEEKVEATI